MNKRNQQTPPGRGASTAEAAPGRVDRVGVGEPYKEVSSPELHLIAIPRENGSKVRLIKAQERSQHSTEYYHVSYHTYMVYYDTNMYVVTFVTISHVGQITI